MRTPQITSKNIKTSVKYQKSPENLQEPLRTAQNKLERILKSHNILGYRSMPQNFKELFRTAMNSRECLRMPQSIPKHLLNVKERLITFRNLYQLLKSYRAENASQSFWNVSKLLWTDNNTLDHVRRPQIVRQPLRHSLTFQKHSKPIRCLRRPHNFIECLKTHGSLSELLGTHENISEQIRTCQKSR